uniref:Integrin subunit beta 3 binding protein n=1 Tax=Nothoprocta perdicaria TaxID=30464 RepID=A0A8C6YMR0_NOTPE
CRVKRALKLDTIKKDNVTTPLKTKKKNLNSYSPTTGTCQMSPFSSPTSHNIVFNLLCRFMELQSKVKNSLAKILKIRENLKSLQALEGSRELENIIGVSDLSCILSAEMQKTQVTYIHTYVIIMFENKDSKTTGARGFFCYKTLTYLKH